MDAFVVERIPRAVYRVSGERPLGYLHDVLAQDVADLREGSGALAAALTADGRIAAEVRVLPLEKDVLLDAEPAAREGIETLIARHAGLAGCEVVDVGEELVVGGARGVSMTKGCYPGLESVARVHNLGRARR